MCIATRLKGKKKMRKCLVPALVCATLASAAWGRPRRRRPWAQAFDRLQPNRTVPLADRWPRPPPPPPTPAQLEIINQKRKWVAGADAAYAKDAREHDGERERAAQAKAASTQRTVISVMDHGAKGDGVADDKAAFEAAVAAARGVKRAVVLLPAGHTFLLSPIALVEESELEIRIDGVVRAPVMERWPRPPQEDASLSAERQRMRYAFLELRYCRSLVISGSGAIEGRGQPWWRRRKRRPEIRAPALLVIRESSDCVVRYLSLVESPFYHVVVLDSERIKLDRLRVATPSGSVNTDGIDVLASSDVTISKCHVSTGDDNVAIKEGSRRVQVLGGLFHKGHGLSIGSLGERHTEQSVEDVLLANVRFYRTSNAARVKTWQGGRGHVRNVTFSNLDVRGVYRPLVLDQFYCPESQHPGICANETDAVAVSDVKVSGIVGWQTSGVAAMLHCSQSKPCGVVATGLDVRSVPGCSNVVRCLNVVPRPGAACANGDDMHGFRLDIPRPLTAALGDVPCVHTSAHP